MSRRPYFDNLAQIIALYDDELLEELTHRLELELLRRAKFDAARHVGEARIRQHVERERQHGHALPIEPA